MMRERLLFTLAAPMASFGDLAGHERRGGADWPARSAILGLVGAALGVEREDDEAQEALSKGYAVSLMARAAGTPLRDYHTVQTIPTARAKRPITRRAALRAVGGDANTTITLRDYRETASLEACLTARPGARWSLSAMADALKKPRFTLYFGRKCCPLAAPLQPRLRRTDTALAAFEADAAEMAEQNIRAQIGLAAPPSFYVFDEDDDPPGGADERVMRRDRALDRRRWHFADAPAHLLMLRSAPEEASP